MIIKLKSLYHKHRELISYVFFGGLTTLVSLTIRYGLYFLNMQPLLATVITWICAVAFAFVVNKVFVFRDKSAQKRDWAKQAAAFYAARLATLGLETAFMFVTVMVLKWHEALMIIIAQVFILIGNYVLSKFVIFRKKQKNFSKPIDKSEELCYNEQEKADRIDGG